MTEIDSTPPPEKPDSDPGLESAPHRRWSHPTPRIGNRLIIHRFMGLGFELASYTLILAGVGYWIDSTRQHAKPYATACGALIGFTLGMIRLIRIARKNAER